MPIRDPTLDRFVNIVLYLSCDWVENSRMYLRTSSAVRTSSYFTYLLSTRLILLLLEMCCNTFFHAIRVALSACHLNLVIASSLS